MRKSKLVDGTPFLGIKIEHFVTKAVFARAMASYYWTYSKEFEANISKSAAMKILKKNLFQQGIQGLDTGGWDGADPEFTHYYEDAYNKSLIWIEINYPYLK